MSQAAAKQTFGECREGHIPRSLLRCKFDARQLAAGLLTLSLLKKRISVVRAAFCLALIIVLLYNNISKGGTTIWQEL